MIKSLYFRYLVSAWDSMRVIPTSPFAKSLCNGCAVQKPSAYWLADAASPVKKFLYCIWNGQVEPMTGLAMAMLTRSATTIKSETRMTASVLNQEPKG